MMRNVLYVVFIILSLKISAQNFERLFFNTYDSYPSDVVQIGNNYFVSCIYVNNIINNQENNSSEIYKLDENGNLIKSLKFDFLNNHVRINKLLKINNDIFLYGINSLDISSFTQQAFIARIDTNLNIKYLQNYFTQNVAYSFINITDFDSTNFLSYYLPGYPYYVSLINKNNGSVELKKGRTDFPFYSLVYLKNKNRIHLYAYNQFSFPIISLDDTLFEVVDSIHFQSLNYSKKSNILINDSTYIIASEQLKNTPNSADAHWDLSVIKVNYDLNNVEEIVYNTYPATLSHKAAFTSSFDFCKTDSNIIFYGGTYNYTLPIPSDFVQQERRFELLKINKQGHLIERKVFSNNNEPYSLVMNSLCATSDGGCIMVGSYWNYEDAIPEQKRAIYILKVDSLGNFNPSLNVKNISEHYRIINFYPNPNSNRILYVTGLKPGDKLFIFNMQGQLIKSIPAQSKIDLSDLTSGIYILSILSDRGEVIKNEKLILQ